MSIEEIATSIELDLRYAFRLLAGHRGFTLVVLLSLAIGIGANSAVFSFVEALLLRPLPYPKANQLVAIWARSPGLSILQDWLSEDQYVRIRNESHSFEQMAIAENSNLALIGGEHAERLDGMRASSTLLRMLGAKPLFGRLFDPDDDAPDKPQVVILSYRAWRRLFGADPQVLGKNIRFNVMRASVAEQYSVVGVLSPDFRLDPEVMPGSLPIDSVDLFLPFRYNELHGGCNVIARMKPGISISEAQVDVNVVADRIRRQEKLDLTFRMTVRGLQDQVVRDVRGALLLSLGTATLVLLIAWANVANLLLSRAGRREREIGIRIAMGASRFRVVHQLLTESILLAFIGGAAGLLVAKAAISVVRAMNPGNIPRLQDVEVNGTVFAFALGVTTLIGILLGLVPARRLLRVDMNAILKSAGGNSRSYGGLHLLRNKFRSLLAIFELAISLVVLVTSGLLIRSYIGIRAVPTGFNSERVLSMLVLGTGARYKAKEFDLDLFQQVEDRVASLPGVESEGLVSVLPLRMAGPTGWGRISIDRGMQHAGEMPGADIRLASVDYFRTMQIPLLSGRFFTEYDTDQTQWVAIIDEQFAHRYWPSESPLGKHVWFDPQRPIIIVGVVGTVKQYGLDVPGRMTVYFPHRWHIERGAYLVLRTSTEATALGRTVVRRIQAIHPDVVVYDLRTMQDRLNDSLARPRFAAVMLAAFALCGLVLAIVGVYTIVSNLVSQSVHDISVHMALGARPQDIAVLVIRQGMALTCLGLALGAVGAAAVARMMASLLFEVGTTDTVTFSVSALTLAAIAFIATVLPARRAAKIDPIMALRDE